MKPSFSSSFPTPTFQDSTQSLSPLTSLSFIYIAYDFRKGEDPVILFVNVSLKDGINWSSLNGRENKTGLLSLLLKEKLDHSLGPSYIHIREVLPQSSPPLFGHRHTHTHTQNLAGWTPSLQLFRVRQASKPSISDPEYKLQGSKEISGIFRQFQGICRAQ